MQGSLSLSFAVGSGTTEGKLVVQADVGGSARGGGAYALPWQTAAWVGLALQNPRKWIPRPPDGLCALRVILSEDNGREVVTVEVHGKIWFETFCTAPAADAQGRAHIIRPAHQIGVALYEAAKRVEELQSAKAGTGVLTDQAVLLAAGIPQRLTNDPRIFEEAKRRAGLDTEYRGLGTARFNSLNSKPLVGLPTAMQFAPGASEFDQLMARARAGTLSRHQRRALQARLRKEG